MTIPSVERLAHPDVHVRPWSCRCSRAAPAPKSRGLHRPDQMRPFIPDRHVQQCRHARHVASGDRRARHGCGKAAIEARLQLAPAVDLHADRPRVGIQPNPCVPQHQCDVRQAERGLRRRIAEFVELAEPKDTAAISTAQPDAARPYLRHMRGQARKGQIHLDPIRGQVWIFRIAKDNILDPLGAKTNIFKVIARLNAAAVHLSANEVFRNGRSLRPQRDKDQRQGSRPDTQPA